MSSLDINPMGNLYKHFLSVINNITIKYVYEASTYDSLEIKQIADGYLDSLNKRDTFFTYIDYTEEELNEVGIDDPYIISEVINGNMNAIPEYYRDQLLLNRRKSIIDNYIEQNNYYRAYNGYPPLNTPDDKFHYLPNNYIKMLNLPDDNIPIHLIQDKYNKINPGDGDYYMLLLEGTTYFSNLIKEYPDELYLRYLGSNRISIENLRTAKNFSIIQLKSDSLDNNFYTQFIQTYEQCRTYFVKVIYNSDFRNIIPYYDRFIGMCIMIMTINTMIMKQIPLGIKRDFYDKVAVTALYEAYNVPYNISIDSDIQSNIIQNLNLLIQNKATDKVFYDIAHLLGFSDINVYKYYLVKERKFNIYDVPIIAETERFNRDTGEYEVVPDYEKMYEVYFQRSELRNQDFISTFSSIYNHTNYTEVTTGDPFWYEDDNLWKRVMETPYNYVESKYLSLGVSYSLTELIFDNTLLLKLLLNEKENISDVRIQLPKITNDNTEIPLFDVVMLLLSLTSAKHNLYGEVIYKPSQVISVVDYIENIDDNKLVDTLSFDFNLFDTNNHDGQALLEEMKQILTESEYEEFRSYISILSIQNDLPVNIKIENLNKMFSNIKAIYKFLETKMHDSNNEHEYEILKRMYRSAFYSKEISDIFMIKTEFNEIERVANNYFEYLYYTNRKLYNAVYKVDLIDEYNKYIDTHGYIDYDEFIFGVEAGNIEISFDLLRDVIVDDTDTRDEKIFYYVKHIISQLEEIINGFDYQNLIRGTDTPIEELLLKLIRFFKSYTVDILGLDHIYICDVKAENLFKFIDELSYIRKVIFSNESFKLNHSDVVHGIHKEFQLEDIKKLIDEYRLQSKITAKDDIHLFDDTNDPYDFDHKLHITSTKVMNENNRFMDVINDNINVNISINETSKLSLQDKVIIKNTQ